MLKSTKLTVAAVMVCFAIMAISSNCVLADDDCGPAPVAKTGQTTCYDLSNNVIDCPDTGHDGDIQAGVAWPEPRFTDNENGTVTDNLTGLIWLKDANCIATRYPAFDNDNILGDGSVTWQHALDFVVALNDGTYPDCGAGHTDWHLPNVKELQSLIDFGNYTPALPSGHPFDNVQSDYYWSSTTYGANSYYAWFVSINDGYMTSYNKPSSLSVWPVRGIFRPCAGWPEPNADLNIKKLEIKEGKKDTKLKVDGSIDLPELGVSHGDIVESRTTIEIFGILPDGSDLVISSEETLEVKHKKHLEIKKQKEHKKH